MAADFNPALATSLDRARFALGDTGSLKDEAGATIWLLDDETINALIGTHGYSEGVAQAADHLCARFAQEPDRYEEESGTRIEWRDRLRTWRDLAKRLRSAPIDGVAPILGSSTVAGQSTCPDMAKFRFGE